MNTCKTRWSLLPWGALNAVARLMTKSAEKHGDKSYETADVLEYQNAAQRHLAAIAMGEMIDSDSSELHATCLSADALIMAYHHEKLLSHEEAVRLKDEIVDALKSRTR